MHKIFSKLDRFFEKWELGILDEPKDSLTTRPAKLSLLPFLRARNAQGCHIFCRPVESLEPYYLLVDDIDQARLDLQHKLDGRFRAGRMIVESSPANFQVWIHSDRPLTNDEKTYWLGRFGSDPGATPRGRWGRMPGFRNRKDKYHHSDGWPLAKLIWVRADAVEIPRMDDSILSATRPPVPSVTTHNSHAGIPQRSDFERYHHNDGTVDQSRVDFAFALTLMRFNIPDDQICRMLRDQRQDWSKHKKVDLYIERTLKAARGFLQGDKR